LKTLHTLIGHITSSVIQDAYTQNLTHTNWTGRTEM